MKSLINCLVLSLLLLQLSARCVAQDKCGKADVYYHPMQVMVDPPEDLNMRDEYDKLAALDGDLMQGLNSIPGLNIMLVSSKIDFSRHHGYSAEGMVSYNSMDRQYHVEVVFFTICSRKELAEVDIAFQMYPSWDEKEIIRKVMVSLKSQVDVEAFKAE